MFLYCLWFHLSVLHHDSMKQTDFVYFKLDIIVEKALLCVCVCELKGQI